MTHLRVLGAISLTDAAGVELRSVTAQPKRIALLTYLAMTTRTAPARRDLILATFWPESDNERGRHALRQALYQLRRSLGEAAILSNGDDEIRVDPEVLSCDAAGFDAALADSDCERAVALYAGDLLPGLHISGAPAFDDWVTAARERLQRSAVDAAAHLANEAQKTGATQDALRWARRAFELAPFDETAFRRYAQTLDRSGERGMALRAFDVFAERLQREIGVVPSDATTRLIDGLRLSPAAVEARASGSPTDVIVHDGDMTLAIQTDAAVRAGDAIDRAGSSHSAAWVRVGGVAVASVATVAVLVGGVLTYGGGEEAPIDASRMAVLPFEVVSAAPEHAYLSEGLVLLFGALLETAPNVTVADPNVSLLAARRDGRNVGVAGERAMAVARGLGAGRLLTGNVVINAERLVLNAWVRDSRSGAEIARTTADGPADSLSLIVNRAAAALVSLGSGQRAERLPDLLTRSPEALRAYLEGAVAYRAGRYETAAPAFRRALEFDSTFVLAAVGYGQAAAFRANVDSATGRRVTALVYKYRALLSPRDRGLLPTYVETFPRRPSALENWHSASHAADIAPELPEVWFTLADYLFHWGDGSVGEDDMARAREAFRRALEVDSTFAPALHHLAELEFYAGDLAQSRRYANLYLRITTEGTTAPLMRWLIAAADGDEAARRLVVRELSETDAVSASAIFRWGQRMPQYRDDAAAALETMLRSAGAGDVLTANLAAFEFALNAGRPAEALRHLNRAYGPQALEHAALALYSGLYSLQTRTDTAALITALEQHARSTRMPAEHRLNAMCHLTHALYHRDDAQGLIELQQRVHAWQPDSIAAARRPVAYHHRHTWCSTLVDAATAVVTRRPGAIAAAERLDSVVTSVALGDHIGVDSRMRRETRAINLLLVRMYERLGAPQDALHAARREIISPDVFLHADRLYEQGRLAAILGHRDETIAAWQKYLALRDQADPVLHDHIEHVRRELRKLASEPL